jgi:hypothetical protein
LDNSCQVSRPTHKNHQSLDVVLTSGDFIIEVILMPSPWLEQGAQTVTDMIRTKYRNIEIPFSMNVQVTPVYQSEQRLAFYNPYPFL